MIIIYFLVDVLWITYFPNIEGSEAGRSKIINNLIKFFTNTEEQPIKKINFLYTFTSYIHDKKEISKQVFHAYTNLLKNDYGKKNLMLIKITVINENYMKTIHENLIMLYLYLLVVIDAEKFRDLIENKNYKNYFAKTTNIIKKIFDITILRNINIDQTEKCILENINFGTTFLECVKRNSEYQIQKINNHINDDKKIFYKIYYFYCDEKIDADSILRLLEFFCESNKLKTQNLSKNSFSISFFNKICDKTNDFSELAFLPVKNNDFSGDCVGSHHEYTIDIITSKENLFKAKSNFSNLEGSFDQKSKN